MDLLHARLPAGAQPQAEPSGGELGQGQRLLRHGDGMAGEGLGDGRSHHDVAGAGAGGGEDAEGFPTSGAAAGHPGGGDAPSLQILHGGQGGVAVGGRHYCANPLLGHIIPPRLAACSRISPHGLPDIVVRWTEVYEGVMASSTTPGVAVRAIAYEIPTPSLQRKPESRHRQRLHLRNETDDLGHWIPAFTGMTVLKPFICDSPGVAVVFRSGWFLGMDSRDGWDIWMWGIPGFQLSQELLMALPGQVR